MKVLALFDLNRTPKPDEVFTPEILDKEMGKKMEADIIASLQRLGHEVDCLPMYKDVRCLLDRIDQGKPDVVFNMIESFLGYRDGGPSMPALLDLLNVRYTGAGPESLLLCKDKSVAKTLLNYHRIPIAKFVISHKRRPLRSLKRFQFPAFVKPLGEESSDGIALASFTKTEEETLARAKFIHDKFGTDALIEEYIDGRELYVSVLGEHRPTVYPARELCFGKIPDDTPKFATAHAKWNDEYRKRWEIDNKAAENLPEGVTQRLERLARKVYRILKIRGLGRIDFRLRPDGEIVFMEANPNPSLAAGDDFPESAAAAGVSYDAMVQKILDLA
jgi:D-alanine-D-alanine ligase